MSQAIKSPQQIAMEARCAVDGHTFESVPHATGYSRCRWCYRWHDDLDEAVAG